MRKTLAIVVTFNRAALLMGCLDALDVQTIPCDILVVDNASTDETPSLMMKRVGEHLFYFPQGSNIGGAGGFNAGLRWGAERRYEYLWVMDDDVFPEPDALEALMKADRLLNQKYGFLSSVSLWTDGRECRMNRQAVHKRFFEHIELLSEGILAIRQATFVSCFFRRETVLKYGLPIKEFFIWGDDIEYTRRLAVRKQLPCYLVGKSKVVHRMASNIGSDIATEAGPRLGRYYYAYRNENYLYRQEGFKGLCYYLARCGYHLVKIWTKAKDHRFKRSGILLKAFFCGWGFHPGVEYIMEESSCTIT